MLPPEKSQEAAEGTVTEPPAVSQDDIPVQLHTGRKHPHLWFVLGLQEL